MQIFIEVLKLIGVSLAQGAFVILIYLADKNLKFLKRLNPYVKQIIFGLILTLPTLMPFYFGMDYMKIYDIAYDVKSDFGPILVAPVISSIIFGWCAGLTTGVIGAIWRFFAVNINVVDYLRFPDSISIFIASLIGILVLKFVIKKKATPKWPYGIILGLIVECVHLLIAFPIISFKYQDIDFAYQIINVADWILLLSTSISMTLCLLWLNLLDKQSINVFKKSNKLEGSIQKRLSLFFILAIFVTFSATAIASVMKVTSDTESDLCVSSQDVVNEIIDTTETEGMIKSDVIANIVSNRRIRTNGFIIIASTKDQTIMAPDNSNYSEPGKYVEFPIKKDQIIAVPNKHVSSIGEDMYFDNDPNKTADKFINSTIKFKDKDGKELNCSCSSMFMCNVLNYNTNKLVPFLAQIIKTNPIKNNNDFYVVSLLSFNEAGAAVSLSMKISMYFEILIYSTIYVLIFMFIRSKVVNNIDSVNSSLSKISAGKLNTVVKVNDYDEFTSLSNDINSTVNVLKGYISAANKRIDDELQYAKNIQMNSLPIVFPNSPYFDLFANMITAKQVGGDFYDFFMIDENQLFFMIADVSGKGIPAAMFMMRAKTLVHSLASTNELSLEDVIDNVNDELNVDNKAGMFVTAWFAILNLQTGELKCVNAGHTRPLIKKKNKYSYLDMKPNMVLGVFPGVKYVLETIQLQPKDQIIIYTDGVTEATNKNKKLYGEERLLNLMNNNINTTAYESIDVIQKELMKFQKNVEQADDITILSLIYKPKKK